MDHEVSAVTVPRVLELCWRPFVPRIDTFVLGGRKTYTNFRHCIPWICRLHCGWALTQCHHRCELDRRKCSTLIGDGTEVFRTHVESAVLMLDNHERVTLLPWYQGNKAGRTTAACTVAQVDM